MLSSSVIDSQPYANSPSEFGAANSPFLGAALVASDFTKVHKLELAGRSSSALPCCPPVWANDLHCAYHGCVSGKPCQYRVSHRDVGAQFMFETELDRSELSFDGLTADSAAPLA